MKYCYFFFQDFPLLRTKAIKSEQSANSSGGLQLLLLFRVFWSSYDDSSLLEGFISPSLHVCVLEPEYVMHTHGSGPGHASPHHLQPVSPTRAPAYGGQGRGEKKKPATLQGQDFIPGLLGWVLDFFINLRVGGCKGATVLSSVWYLGNSELLETALIVRGKKNTENTCRCE